MKCSVMNGGTNNELQLIWWSGVKRDTNNASNQPRMMTPHTDKHTHHSSRFKSGEYEYILISYLCLLSPTDVDAVVVILSTNSPCKVFIVVTFKTCPQDKICVEQVKQPLCENPHNIIFRRRDTLLFRSWDSSGDRLQLGRSIYPVKQLNEDNDCF